MTPTDTELERLAKAATPGPWENHEQDFEQDAWIGKPQENGRAHIICEGTFASSGLLQVKANFAYIAAFNPAVALDLLSRLHAAETEKLRLFQVGKDQLVKMAILRKERDEAWDAAIEGACLAADNAWEHNRQGMKMIAAIRALKKAPRHE